MKKRLVISIALVALSCTTAFARGGMGGIGMSHMGSAQMGISGGSFGTSPYTPGTNSLGTALPSSGAGRPIKGLLKLPSTPEPAAHYETQFNWASPSAA
jgi:hypothetical protein